MLKSQTERFSWVTIAGGRRADTGSNGGRRYVAEAGAQIKRRSEPDGFIHPVIGVMIEDLQAQRRKASHR